MLRVAAVVNTRHYRFRLCYGIKNVGNTTWEKEYRYLVVECAQVYVPVIISDNETRY